MPKLLTLVVTGRNDSYMGNFLYRLATCLNFAARQLDRLHRLEDVEFLVTDWGSEKPLSDALNLSPEAQKIVRFVYVPPEITQKARPDGDFFPACAINTSVRRGKGEFIILFDADSLFPSYSFRALFDLLDGKLDIGWDIPKAFFFLNRYPIPWESAQHQFSPKDWERYLLLHTGNLARYRPGFGLGLSGSGQMMHRELWRAYRGYNERLVGQAWIDCDLTLRVTQTHPLIDLAGIGLNLFHMEHWPHNKKMNPTNKILNLHAVSMVQCVNGPDWGLGEHDLEIAKPISGERQKADPRHAGGSRPCEALQQSKVGEAREKRKSSDGSGPSDQKAYLRPKFSALSPEKLIGEINSAEVREHVKKYLDLTEKLEGEADYFGISETEVDTESLFILSWYALNHFPRAMLDYGMESAHQLGIVAMACWTVEISGIRPWDEQGTKAWPSFLLLEKILWVTGHCGHARHISGNLQTALQRLKESWIPKTRLDLAIFNDHPTPSLTLRQMALLFPLLEPGALFFLKCETPGRLQELLPQIQGDFPAFYIIPCGSGRNAMLFNEGGKTEG